MLMYCKLCNIYYTCVNLFYSMQFDCLHCLLIYYLSVADLFCSVYFSSSIIHLVCVSILLYFQSLTNCTIFIGGTITTIASFDVSMYYV